MDEKEKQVFQSLSVFEGGFTREAAGQVGGARLRDLRALTAKSLLQYTPSGRYQNHELLRQYAAEKLSLSPDARKEAFDRHCAYYCAALERWGTDLFGSRQHAALVEMEAESENIRAAWTWAVGQGQVERLGPATDGLEHFYWQSGRFREREAALRSAAAAAAEGTVRRPAQAGAADRAACLRVQARALAWQSNFPRAVGQRDAACRLQAQCLVILQDPALAGSDTRLERAILSWVVGATVCMDDYVHGRQQFEQSYALFCALDHRWGMAWALNAWGTMSISMGDYQDAKRRLKEGLAICRALGNASSIAGCVSRLAGIAMVGAL